MPCPKKGYTLIELMIVISIMGLLSVSAIVYTRSLSKEKMLSRASDSIQSLLRTAQTNATSSFNCGDSLKSGGWSVEFSNNNNKTDIYLSCTNSALRIKTLSLENNVQVKSIAGSECKDPVALPVTVSYSSLYGKVSFSGLDHCIAKSATLAVTVGFIDSSDAKSFTISNGGAINAE